MPFSSRPLRHFGLHLTAASALALSACGNDEGEAGAEPVERPVEFTVVQPYEPSASAVYVGQLQNAQTSMLSFEVPGTIATMVVELGDEFEAGQTLATLDGRNFDLDIERREAEMVQAQAELTDAEQDYARKNALRGTGAVAGAAIDGAKARRDSAASALNGLNTALAQAEKAESDTRLRAPFAGTVLSRAAQPGQTLSAGQPVLSVSENGQNLEALISLTQQDLQTLSRGDSLPVRVTALGRSVAATVTEISTSANSSLAFPVVLALETSEGLRAGMGVEVALGRGDGEIGRVMVPLPAVQIDNSGQHFVYTLDSSDAAQRTPVTISRIVDTGYVLSSGPPIGTRVISRGAVQVKLGEPLKLLDPDTRRFPE